MYSYWILLDSLFREGCLVLTIKTVLKSLFFISLCILLPKFSR